MDNSDDIGPATQPVRKWRARLAKLLLWLRPHQHDHQGHDAQGNRW